MDAAMNVIPAPHQTALRQYPAAARRPARRGARSLLAAGLLSLSVTALAQGTLENPRPAGIESGIGLVSGWHCNAGTVQIQFDNGALTPAAYGTPRADTAGICGDSDNGFGLLWNYNLLGPGPHVVRAFADGVQFASANFEVHTLGQEFIEGLTLTKEITALDIGKQLELSWQQSKQGFVISRVKDAELSLDDLITALGGKWFGAWNSPLGAGAVNVTLAETQGGDLALTQAMLTNTGCATNAISAGPLQDIDDPLIEITMSDGSHVDLEFVTTESLTTLGGTFVFTSGACKGQDGVFHMFRQ